MRYSIPAILILDIEKTDKKEFRAYMKYYFCEKSGMRVIRALHQVKHAFLSALLNSVKTIKTSKTNTASNKRDCYIEKIHTINLVDHKMKLI